MDNTNDVIVCCPDCGAVNQWATDQTKLMAAEVRKLTARVTELEGKRAKAPKVHERYLDGSAAEVLQLWKALCMPKARGLESGKRLTNLIARYDDGYEQDALLTCVFGYSLRPFQTRQGRAPAGAPWERRVDAELIFRDPWHVDQGLALAETAPPSHPARPVRTAADRLQIALGV